MDEKFKINLEHDLMTFFLLNSNNLKIPAHVHVTRIIKIFFFYVACNTRFDWLMSRVYFHTLT